MNNELKTIPKIKGAIPDLEDKRDFKFETVFGEALAAGFDWERGFDAEEGNPIPFRHQIYGTCVSEAFAYYLEILNRKEEGKFVDLSPRFIYALAKALDGLPENEQGTYLRVMAKVAVDYGITLERLFPSQINKPNGDFEVVPYSKYKDTSLITPEMYEYARKYRSKRYFTTYHQGNIETVALMIQQGFGVASGAIGSNEGWTPDRYGFVRPPLNGEKTWGHATFFGKAGLHPITNEKCIRFKNSWGDKWGVGGYGYFRADYFQSGYMFSPWTLIDAPNQEDMLKIIGDRKTGRQYTQGADGKLRWIFGEQGRDSAMLSAMHRAGIVNKNEVQWHDDVEAESFEFDKPWAELNS